MRIKMGKQDLGEWSHIALLHFDVMFNHWMNCGWAELVLAEMLNNMASKPLFKNLEITGSATNSIVILVFVANRN